MTVTAAQVWMVLGAALGAAILTSAGALGIAAFQAKRAAALDQTRRAHELERDRREDERKIRDAKADRIREIIAVVALAAGAYEAVGVQLTVLWAGETKEARAERLSGILTKASEDLGPAVIRLQLEPGMEGAADTYKAVSKAFVAFRIGTEMMEQTPRYSPPNILDNLKTLETGAVTIIAFAKAKLAELEQPL